jgi:hypothetical protein
MAELLEPRDAVAQIEPLLAHLWMVRTFLKHAEEIQDSLEMLEVPRNLFDVIRATEPALQSCVAKWAGCGKLEIFFLPNTACILTIPTIKWRRVRWMRPPRRLRRFLPNVGERLKRRSIK